MNAPTHPTLALWHRLVSSRDASGLDALLSDDVVFHSPVVHSAQRGKPIAIRYLSAAFAVFFDPSFRYVRELADADGAVLEFEVELDGILVNGVDMLRWNADGRVTDFKVMIRPLKAITLIHEKMAALLRSSAG